MLLLLCFDSSVLLVLRKTVDNTRVENTVSYNKSKVFRLSHDVVTCDVDRDVSTATDTASLLQAMRSTGHA